MRKNTSIISPPLFMLIGTLYYLVSPAFFYFNNYFELGFIRDVVSEHTTSSSGVIYRHIVIDFVVINLFFSLGFFVAKSLVTDKLVNNRVNRFSKFRLLPNFILLMMIFIQALILVKAFTIGFVFFSGYSSYEISILGPLATICFMNMWFYIYFMRKRFLILFVLSSMLLLGAGSRMFFVLPMLSLLILKILTHPEDLKKYYIIFFSLVLSMLMVGLWREGSVISVDGLLTILFAEPIFTSIGGMYYFELGFPSFNIPYDIAAAFVNFIPSAIFPEKLVWINSIKFDERIFNPLGAQSLIINLYKNFGYFYPVFMFLFGCYFGGLYKSKSNRFFYTVYIMSLPLLLLHFQREGFITVFKILVFNGLFFPLILIVFLGLILEKKVS
ncbi:O-antigen polymerase [Vibrio sp. DNB22_19_1]